MNLAECFLYTTYVDDDDALMIIIILMMHIFYEIRKSLYSLIWIFILEFLIIFQEFTFFVFTTCDKLDFDYVIAPEHGCRCSALFFFYILFFSACVILVIIISVPNMHALLIIKGWSGRANKYVSVLGMRKLCRFLGRMACSRYI